MSLAATSYVLHRRFGNQTRKLIMIAIADFADDSGKAWPSIDTLADRAECSRRSIQDHLQTLRSEGHLVIVPNAGRGGTHLYKIVFKKSDSETLPSSGGAKSAPPVQMSGGNFPEGGANDGRPSAPEPSGTVIEPSESSPLPPPSGGTISAQQIDASLIEKIRGLRPDWDEPGELDGREKRKFKASRNALASLPDATWDLLRRYLAKKFPTGAAYWQPDSRERFIQSPGDVVRHAKRWQRKLGEEKPNPCPIPSPAPGRVIIPRDQLSKMMDEIDAEILEKPLTHPAF